MKPRIAVFSGPTATIQNSEPLVTSNKAREKYGLPLRLNPDGSRPRSDALRPQRLVAPAVVYVRQFSAHPLESDAAELYAPPDGYIDAAGVFHTERLHADDVPVFEIVLLPEDGLYPLPYMARQANGQAWEDDCVHAEAPDHLARQPFYPDASRIFEEIDRFGLGERGVSNLLTSKAEFDFIRAAPSGGYKQGLPAAARTDLGDGDIPPERRGVEFFPYRPRHLKAEPLMSTLARLTNAVQRTLDAGKYDGAIWLEGSPTVEETTYWLNLLIDTTVPIAGNASQRPHGALSNDGDRNIVDAVDYVVSRIWADTEGRDTIGAVVIQDEQIFTARDVQKADARPGGYIATGGHGGIVGTIGQPGPPELTFRTLKKHTSTSEVNVRRLPHSVHGVREGERGVETVAVHVKDERGELLPTAIPKVSIVKFTRYQDSTGERGSDTDISAWMQNNLREAPLSGFVAEAAAPFGSVTNAMDAALRKAVLCGMPVVKVGRGNAEGIVPREHVRLAIAGSNLTATKARLLLMACLLRFGCLPPAIDPDDPTDAELAAVEAKLAQYQAVFDTH